jgi:hypothetical protein
MKTKYLTMSGIHLFVSTAKILHIIGNCEQRQDSTLEQLRDLKKIADLAGMYDAAEVIQQLIDNEF